MVQSLADGWAHSQVGGDRDKLLKTGLCPADLLGVGAQLLQGPQRLLGPSPVCGVAGAVIGDGAVANHNRQAVDGGGGPGGRQGGRSPGVTGVVSLLRGPPGGPVSRKRRQVAVQTPDPEDGLWHAQDDP